MPTPIIKLDCELIERLYVEGRSIPQLAPLFKVNQSTIRNRLLDRGVKIRSSVEVNKCYTYDKNFFLRNTPASWYIAGLLSADGCVSDTEKQNSKIVSLNITDVILTAIMKLQMKTSNPIQISNPKNRKEIYRLKISDNNLAEILKEKFGIGPRKSLTLEFPNHLKENKLISHYVRGYFDGDGCISIDKKSECKLSFCATKNFAEDLKMILNEVVDKKSDAKLIRHNKRKTCYWLEYGGNKQIAKIAEWMYDEADELYLPRKFNRFHRILDMKLIEPQIPKLIKVGKRFWFPEDKIPARYK